MPQSVLSATESSEQTLQQGFGSCSIFWEPGRRRKDHGLSLRCASWATSQEAIKKAKTRRDKLRFHKNDFSIGPYSHGEGHLKHGYTHLPTPCVQGNGYFNFSSFWRRFTPTHTQTRQPRDNPGICTVLCSFSHMLLISKQSPVIPCSNLPSSSWYSTSLDGFY